MAQSPEGSLVYIQLTGSINSILHAPGCVSCGGGGGSVASNTANRLLLLGTALVFIPSLHAFSFSDGKWMHSSDLFPDDATSSWSGTSAGLQLKVGAVLLLTG